MIHGAQMSAVVQRERSLKTAHTNTHILYKLSPSISFWVLGCIVRVFGFEDTFSAQFLYEDPGIRHLLVSSPVNSSLFDGEVSQPGLTFLNREAGSGVFMLLHVGLLGFLAQCTWCQIIWVTFRSLISNFKQQLDFPFSWSKSELKIHFQVKWWADFGSLSPDFRRQSLSNSAYEKKKNCSCKSK